MVRAASLYLVSVEGSIPSIPTKSIIFVEMNFHQRKKERTERYEKYVKGWKQRPCTACNGSGYYDHNGSPKCGACNGTGKEKYKPNE